jgi:hypothetical protein
MHACGLEYVLVDVVVIGMTADTLDVLMALARSLDVKEDYLLGEPEMALDGVEFRKKASMSAKEEAQVEAHVLHLLEIETFALSPVHRVYYNDG